MSCSNMEQTSFPSSGAMSTSSSEVPFSFSQIMEGYDNEFVRHPESRYECPICLLVLREPRQTKCGHRFCRDCIIRSMRDSSSRCPVDNEPLKESDIYPDNFAKREILNFDIKCPNKKYGCDKIFPLGKLQNHLEECPYALMPCPYKCAFIMQRVDVDQHLATVCENRIVVCEHCQSNLQAKFLQNHLEVCPFAIVACPHCKEQRVRNELKFHIQSECQLVEVHCPFYLMGCNQKMVRSSVDDHLMHACSSHMKQLCHAVTCIAEKLGMAHVIDETSSKSLPEALNSMLRDVNSVSTTVKHNLSQDGSYPLDFSIGQALLSSESVLSQMQPLTFDHGSGRSVKSMPTKNVTSTPLNSFDDGQHRITVAQYQSHEPADLSASLTSESDFEETQRPSPSSQMPKAKLPVRRLNHQPIHFTPSANVMSPQSESSHHSFQEQFTEATTLSNTDMIKIVQDLSSRFEQREVIQQQKFYELYNRLTTVDQLNATLLKKVKDLEQLLAERDARFYYGDFYWSINHFSQYRTKLAAGEKSLLHSPPFYSNPWGYKMCVRANIDKNQDTIPHLALFVHFMQGRNDTFLSWPFSGKITISVIDQNPDVNKRTHMKETLKSSPNLAAFQRPTTPKNVKGFGYTEFLSIAALENGSYLMEDTLVVRVQVFDDFR